MSTEIAPEVEQAPPAIDVAAQEPVVEEPTRIPGPEEVADELPEDPTPPADDENDELEFGFEKYTVPKKLKTAVESWRAATTQKEQEVAQAKRALDTEIEQSRKATDDELKDRAVLIAVQEQLDQYKTVDWLDLYRKDPAAHGEHQARFQQLQQLHNQTAESLKTKQTERTQLAERDLANRVEETVAFAQKAIPGWKPELTETLVKFAQSEGIPDEVIKSNWSPTFYGLLHKAHIGSLAMQKINAPKPAAAPVAPLATVSGKSTPAARTDLESADMETYVALRKKGVGGKAPR